MNIYIRKGTRCCVCEKPIENSCCLMVGSISYMVSGLVTNSFPQPVSIVACSRECLEALLKKQNPIVEGKG